MLDKWQNGVITNAGVSMLGEILGGGELTITRAALGGGTVDNASLMEQTELTSPLDVVTLISKKTIVDGKGVNVVIQIRNVGITETQVMKQVGLFAKVGEGEERLFAVMQDDSGEQIPSEASYPDFLLEFTAALAVSNTGNINVTVSGNTVITRELLDMELKDYAKIVTTTTAELKALIESGKADKNTTYVVTDYSSGEFDPSSGGGGSSSSIQFADESDLTEILS